MTIKLSAKTRTIKGRKTYALKNADRIPAVVYGHKVKNILLDIDYKDFQKILREAGESSLIELNIEGEKEKKPVLVHEIQKDPVTGQYIHVDFFQVSLTEKVHVKVALVLEGVSLAEKELGGTVVKNMSEIEVKAMATNLPHEIKVSIESLKTFEDHILVKDLVLPAGVEIVAKPDEIVVSVSAPTNIEEELAKEIEEKVEDVEKVEKDKKVEDVVEETAEEKKG